jgi:hypothetical protein
VISTAARWRGGLYATWSSAEQDRSGTEPRAAPRRLEHFLDDFLLLPSRSEASFGFCVHPLGLGPQVSDLDPALLCRLSDLFRHTADLLASFASHLCRPPRTFGKLAQ